MYGMGNGLKAGHRKQKWQTAPTQLERGENGPKNGPKMDSLGSSPCFSISGRFCGKSRLHDPKLISVEIRWPHNRGSTLRALQTPETYSKCFLQCRTRHRREGAPLEELSSKSAGGCLAQWLSRTPGATCRVLTRCLWRVDVGPSIGFLGCLCEHMLQSTLTCLEDRLSGCLSHRHLKKGWFGKLI